MIIPPALLQPVLEKRRPSLSEYRSPGSDAEGNRGGGTVYLSAICTTAYTRKIKRVDFVRISAE